MTVLLNEIEGILKRDKKTVSDVARDIGRDYHQVYGWLRVRRFNPGATGLMLLMQWRNKNLSAASGESLHSPPDGEKPKKRRRRFTTWR